MTARRLPALLLGLSLPLAVTACSGSGSDAASSAAGSATGGPTTVVATTTPTATPSGSASSSAGGETSAGGTASGSSKPTPSMSVQKAPLLLDLGAHLTGTDGSSMPTGAKAAVAWVTQRLGQPDEQREGIGWCAKGRAYEVRWGDLTLLIDRKGTGTGEQDTKPNTVAGWSVIPGEPAEGAGTVYEFRTDRGITLGSTLAAVKKAYPDGVLVEEEIVGGPLWQVFRGDISNLDFLLVDASGAVKALRGGTHCFVSTG